MVHWIRSLSRVNRDQDWMSINTPLSNRIITNSSEFRIGLCLLTSELRLNGIQMNRMLPGHRNNSTLTRCHVYRWSWWLLNWISLEFKIKRSTPPKGWRLLGTSSVVQQCMRSLKWMIWMGPTVGWNIQFSYHKSVCHDDGRQLRWCGPTMETGCWLNGSIRTYIQWRRKPPH